MLSSLFPNRKFIRLDGGMGSMLQKGGMPVGALPEVYNITEPERIISAQKQFVAVGSDIIYANTFGANRHKMAKSGYSVQELIAAGIACKVRSRALDLGIAAVLFALTVRSAIRLDPYSIGYLATAFTCFAVSGLKEE